LHAGFQIAYGICFLLSILYSVPPFRFKAVAGVDWVINMWGFGTLTPYAAWAATGRPLDVGYGLILFAFCPLFAGLILSRSCISSRKTAAEAIARWR
jgi:hypothetical protein